MKDRSISRREFGKILAGVGTFGIANGFNLTNASAKVGTTTSATYWGNTYYATASIYDYSTYAQGAISVSATSSFYSESVQINLSVYRDEKCLITSTKKNPSTTTYFKHSVNATAVSGYQYYTLGNVRVYQNSSSFQYFHVPGAYMADIEDDLPVNIKGETYGSWMYNSYTIPDLISAIGINGFEGYIRHIDLAPYLCMTLPLPDNEGTIYIPVYDVNRDITLDQYPIVVS